MTPTFQPHTTTQGFQKLQEMIFSQLNEKMRAMDRSLLEKIAADIEMMDQEQGLSPEEFEKFLKRVPSHLKEKFQKIASVRFSLHLSVIYIILSFWYYNRYKTSVSFETY